MNELYVDIETEGLNPFESQIAICQVLDGKDVKIFQGDDVKELKPLLESSLVIGHNLVFDLGFLEHHYGIKATNVYDTMLAELVLSGGLYVKQEGVTGLKDLARKYPRIEMDKTEQTTFKKGQVLTPEQIKYAALDVQVLPTIYQAQQDQIKELQLEDTIDIEMKCLPGTVWLRRSGMYLNLEKVDLLRPQVQVERDQLYQDIKTEIQKEIGHVPNDFNLNSPIQLKGVLNKMGLKCTSTKAEELEKIPHLIAGMVCGYRQKEQFLNDTIDKMPERINPATGRIHADFNQLGARSGRYSCSKPNMQSQPHNPAWREVFTATPGNKIVTADYSQIELRILGAVSDDPVFIEAYKSDQDLHKLTAANVLNKPVEEVTKEERQIAKKANFGIIYGEGCTGLKKSLAKEGVQITEKQADQFIQGFYRSYPEVREYVRSVEKEGILHLELRNKAGRLYKFENPRNNPEKGEVKRQCRNLPIQGLCADMIKIAIGNLYRILEPMGVRFVNCVHDELVFECTTDQADEVARIVKAEMEKAGSMFLTKIPCVVEVTVADSWSK